MLEINGFKVVPTIFPDKTSQVWKLDEKLFKKVKQDQLINVLWKFENESELLHLNQAIGLIYGDSITYERCQQICERLKRKGFASTNVVYGIGSYTYQYVTRDTYSLACKATWVRINGKPKNIYKDPKTGDGMKKSAKGLLAVTIYGGHLVLKNECSLEEEQGGELRTVFENGRVLIKETLSGIRARLHAAF